MQMLHQLHVTHFMNLFLFFMSDLKFKSSPHHPKSLHGICFGYAITSYRRQPLTRQFKIITNFVAMCQ